MQKTKFLQFILRALVGLSALHGSLALSAPTDSERVQESEAGSNSVPDTLLGPAPPYEAKPREISAEFGLFRVDEDAFWLAANTGWRLPRCLIGQSDGCRQYFDLIAGGGVREAQTYGLFLGSLRWQFVHNPQRESFFLRVFSGSAYVARLNERRFYPMGGAGAGVITYLHNNVDLRAELRTGYIDRAFLLAVVAMQIKLDHIAEYLSRPKTP